MLILILWGMSTYYVPAQAQKVGRERIIVTYCYNFIKSTEWPQSENLSVYEVFVVTQDSVLRNEFKKLAQAKLSEGRSLKMHFFFNFSDINSKAKPHLLFASQEIKASPSELTPYLKNGLTLVITDEQRDSRYTMINLEQGANNRLIFTLNNANIQANGLSIDPQLILLGGKEEDLASLYKESQQTLSVVQSKADSIASASQELYKQIFALKTQISANSSLLTEQDARIKQQQGELTYQKETLDAQSQYLKDLEGLLEEKSMVLGDKEQEIARKESILQHIQDTLSLTDAQIKKQYALIDSLNANIELKNRVLDEQNYVIASKNRILLGLIALSFLFLLSTYMLYNWNKQKKRINQILVQSKQDLERANLIEKQINEQLQYSQNRLNESLEELLMQKEEIEAQRDLVSKQNAQLSEAQQEIEEKNREIRNHNRKLEKEVEKRTVELVQYNQQLEQFAFLSAHNLRAPVARLIGLGKLFELSNTEDEMDEIRQKMLITAHDIDRVIRELASVLEIKRNVTNTFSRVNLEDELRSVITTMSDQIGKSKTQITWDFSEADTIYAIRPYLQTILHNLISNSIKFRRPEVPNEIKIYTSTGKKSVRLHISDNGLGIDLPQFEKKLFRLYERFHLHVEGKGLGLYITKTQLEAMGGKIHVISEPNKGTTVTAWFRKM
ncbi:YfiR/HmsC family protein [Cytophagales bacterium LB-30]|uniref:histidine kinase n=1 Tax=Shiella aurantiaca TaxID=3058365 RepID=A0ABT8F2Z0_9BACT|nr:YfiR/HmsC family protein [Shiella aurantiaca]MDN4164792.1 YfiR/HmsC family protein [Shiella aurantiaca]